MTVNHGVLGSSPCSGADARGLRKVLSETPAGEVIKRMKNFDEKFGVHVF